MDFIKSVNWWWVIYSVIYKQLFNLKNETHKGILRPFALLCLLTDQKCILSYCDEPHRLKKIKVNSNPVNIDRKLYNKVVLFQITRLKKLAVFLRSLFKDAFKPLIVKPAISPCVSPPESLFACVHCIPVMNSSTVTHT